MNTTCNGNTSEKVTKTGTGPIERIVSSNTKKEGGFDTMFTQPCFINKNTKELKYALKDLGYKDDTNIWCTKSRKTYAYHYPFSSAIFLNADSLDIPFAKGSSLRGKFIDCGDNEDLFLAIAAMNDENDYMQWFVCDDGVSMFRIDQKRFSADKFVHEYMTGWDTTGYRKATVKELIEEFG